MRSSNTGEEEDWDRMDSASDLDAAANALQVADGGGTVHGGGVSQKLTILECFADFPSATAGIADGEFWSSTACEAVEVI